MKPSEGGMLSKKASARILDAGFCANKLKMNFEDSH